MHWVPRQNKLELPNDEEEVNTRDIHKCDGQTHDPDTMTVPLTPKPTQKAEALAKAPPTIASRRKEDVALKEVAKPLPSKIFFFKISLFRFKSECVKLSFRGGFSRCSIVPYPV
jgi:hypothetical protein